MSAYVVAVRSGGSVDHVGPFRDEERAKRYASLRSRENGCRAAVHPLYRLSPASSARLAL
jgi:hypothetical protein